MENQKIAIASDHAGLDLKMKISEFLNKKGYSFKDFGTYSKESCDYTDFAHSVSAEVAKGDYTRGILVCGSGIGMSIAANKTKGIRAALCWNKETAMLSRAHNDSNVLCLGERMLDETLALEIVETWLSSDFEGGRHQKRVDKIEE